MSFENDASKRSMHKAHEARLAQYETILAGNLTPAQRDFVKRRVKEEHEALREVVGGVPRENINSKQ